jgi:O-methyltransferase
MDNFYIEQYFDWRVRRTSFLDRVVTKILNSLGSRLEFRSADFIDRTIERIIRRDYRFVSSGISTNIDQRINMYHLVRQVLAYGVEGDLVELGCNEGSSSILISKILADTGSAKKLFLFDSFEGLPSAKAIDGVAFKQGDLATTEDVVHYNFKKYALPLPEIHRGWFKDTLSNLPGGICFAYLDGDLYDSIFISLEYVYPRMTAGAICLVDDYCDPDVNPRGWNKLPGVKKACDDYLRDKPEKIEFIYSGSYSHGYFRKKI